MKRIHFISGVLLTLFIGVHLLNHFISIFGVDEHIRFMNTTRVIYRNIFVESLLLLAVFIQILSGSKLVLVKRKTVNSFFPKLQLWTGFYMAFFLLIHVGAVLTGRFILHLDTNFYFGVAGLNAFPTNLFFIPYYGLAILSFFGHLAAIHQQKMKYVILGLSPNQQARVILIQGVFVLFFILYGLTNGFAGIEIPEEYQVLIGR